jgi:hypothetical protein
MKIFREPAGRLHSCVLLDLKPDVSAAKGGDHLSTDDLTLPPRRWVNWEILPLFSFDQIFSYHLSEGPEEVAEPKRAGPLSYREESASVMERA